MNREEFKNEVGKLGVEMTNKMMTDLDKYYQILKEENTKYNLTRIIEKNDVYLKHFYDTLTILKITAINNQKICDIGSGAGFPGLVLGICFPQAKISLIESNGKKCKFLELVKNSLMLNNIEVINSRAEEYANNHREIYDIVTARAVAPLKHLLEYGIPLVKVNGYFIAMKANVQEEEKNIEKYYNKLSILEEKRIVLDLPNEQSIRTLIKYKKEAITDKIYPRKYSEIKKKEL